MDRFTGSDDTSTECGGLLTVLLFCIEHESHKLDRRLTCGQLFVVEEHGMEEVGGMSKVRFPRGPVSAEDILVRPGVIGPVLEN